MGQGLFITLEGVEGAGKSTAMEQIADYLRAQRVPFLLTREPGGTRLAEKIRELLLKQHEEEVVVDAELLLYFASRAQHLALRIKPALQQGVWVICDRFTDATYAYQGAGRGVPLERIACLEKWVQQGLEPDGTILLDLPVALSAERIKQRGKAIDRLESEDHQFFERVRDGYLAIARRFPNRYRIIDARSPLPLVAQALQGILSDFISKWQGCHGGE